jgi:hypothetical protein
VIAAARAGMLSRVGAPEPDPNRLAPLRGPRRGLAIAWVIGVVALHLATRLGLVLVR